MLRSMRRDLDRDDEGGARRLDASMVRGHQQALRQDPRQRLARMRSLITVLLWLMAAAAVLAVVAYYGRILWSGLALGKAGEKHYQDMVKDNSGD
jgi:hypothetical protein